MIELIGGARRIEEGMGGGMICDMGIMCENR